MKFILLICLTLLINEGYSLQNCINNCENNGIKYDVKIVSNSENFNLNGPFTLKCKVTPSLFSASYKWYKDNNFMKNGENFVIDKFTNNDFGTYKCIVEGKGQYNSDMKMEATRTIYGRVKEQSYTLTIESNPKSFSINNPIELTCKLSPSHDNVDYTWLKNGQLIQIGKQLVFQSFTKDKMGTYRCEAVIKSKSGSNLKVFAERWFKYSNVETKFTAYNLEISTVPQIARLNQELILYCTLTPYNHNVNVKWFKDNVLVAMTNTYKISNVDHSTFGVYTCKADGRLPSGISFYQERSLTVNLPQIYSQTERKASIFTFPNQPIYGQKLEVVCQYPQNLKLLSIKWMKNGAFYQNGPQLIFSQFSSQNEGVYKCISEMENAQSQKIVIMKESFIGFKDGSTKYINNKGATTKHNLDIIAIPNKVNIGGSLQLDCQLKPFENKVKYYWYRNGQFLKEGRYVFISNFQKEHFGTYKCLAQGNTNSGHFIKMEAFYYYSSGKVNTVADEKYKVFIQQEESKVTVGGPITLSCIVFPSNEKVTLQWFKDGILIGTGVNYRISKFDQSHSGQYKCVVNGYKQSGKAFRIESDVINYKYESKHLMERYNLIINTNPDKLRLNEKAEIYCVVYPSGNKVAYRWFKNDKLVGTDRTMVFDKLKESDLTLYSCEAKISVAKDKNIVMRGKINLNIKYYDIQKKYQLNIKVEPQEFQLNDRIILKCQANPNENNVRYNWFKNDKYIGSGYEYSISKLMKGDIGLYKCVAQVTVETETFSLEAKLHLNYRTNKITNKVIIQPSVNNNYKVKIDTSRLQPELGKHYRLVCRLVSTNGTEEIGNTRYQWIKDGMFYKYGKFIEFDQFVECDYASYKCVVEKVIQGRKVKFSKKIIIRTNTTSKGDDKKCRPCCEPCPECPKLNVNYKIQIDSVPEVFSCESKIVLRCNVEPFQNNIIYKWKLNGYEVGNEKEYSIENHKGEVKGKYECTAKVPLSEGSSVTLTAALHQSNLVGCTKSKAMNTNFDIIIQQDPLIITVGDKVKFRCDINTIDSRLKYQWKRGNKMLSSERILIVDNFDQSKEGVYECFVTINNVMNLNQRFKTEKDVRITNFNNVGNKNSSSNCLDNSCYGIFPRKQAKQIKESIIFYCSLPNHRSYKWNDIKWFFEGAQQKGGKKLLVTSTGWNVRYAGSSSSKFMLFKKSAEISDSGFYYCQGPDGTYGRGELIVSMNPPKLY